MMSSLFLMFTFILNNNIYVEWKKTQKKKKKENKRNNKQQIQLKFMVYSFNLIPKLKINQLKIFQRYISLVKYNNLHRQVYAKKKQF